MCKCSSITAADHQAVHKWRIVQLQVKIHRCFLVKAFFWVTYQMISRSKSHKCPSPPQHSARSCCYPKMVTFDHWVSLSEFSYCLFLFCSIRQLSWVPSRPPHKHGAVVIHQSSVVTTECHFVSVPLLQAGFLFCAIHQVISVMCPPINMKQLLCIHQIVKFYHECHFVNVPGIKLPPLEENA